MRLFVAVDPSATTMHAVKTLLEELRPLAPNAKWISPENLHVTLAFLGHKNEALVEPIGDAVFRVAQRHHTFSLEISGGGVFGNVRKPKVLWLGIRGALGALGALAKLQEDLQAELVPFGYEADERPFAPHLTLARSRNFGDPALAVCARKLEEVKLGSTIVEELVLYRSELSSKGPTYTAVRRFRLLSCRSTADRPARPGARRG